MYLISCEVTTTRAVKISIFSMPLLRWEGPGDEANPTVSLFVNTLLLTKVFAKGIFKTIY